MSAGPGTDCTLPSNKTQLNQVKENKAQCANASTVALLIVLHSSEYFPAICRPSEDKFPA
jgi:hypothetical protein